MLLYKLVIINVQLIGQLCMMELLGRVVLDQLFIRRTPHMVTLVQTISLVPVLKMQD
jgi:hypothetical protein